MGRTKFFNEMVDKAYMNARAIVAGQFWYRRCDRSRGVTDVDHGRSAQPAAIFQTRRMGATCREETPRDRHLVKILSDFVRYGTVQRQFSAEIQFRRGCIHGAQKIWPLFVMGGPLLFIAC